MFKHSYLTKRRSILFLIVIGIFLTACSGATGREQRNWPGLAADGDRVFVAYQSIVASIDVADEQTVWNYLPDGQQIYAPPVFASEDKLIVGDFGSSGGLFSTGLTVGVHLIDDSNGPSTSAIVNTSAITGRIFAPALIVDDLVYLGTGDNALFAFELADFSAGDTGQPPQPVWSFSTGNAIWSEPVYHNGVLYFAALDKYVYAVNASDGSLVWQAELPGAAADSPVINVEADLIYAGTFDGSLYALDIDSGAEQWSKPAEDWVWGSPALLGRLLVYTDLQGNVYAVDANTGAEEWGPIQLIGSIEAQPLVYDGNIYIASADSTNDIGYLTALAADGSQLWQTQTAAPLNVAPVAAADSIVVVMFSDEVPLQIVKYNSGNGSTEWTHPVVPSQ